MDRLKQAVERATADGATLAALLQSTRAVLVDCDRQIAAFDRSGERRNPGGLRRFADGIVPALSTAISLCRLANERSRGIVSRLDEAGGEAQKRADRGGGSVGDAFDRLMTACTETRAAMLAMQRSVRESEGRVREVIEVLREAVLRHDGEPEVRRAVDALLERLARPGHPT